MHKFLQPKRHFTFAMDSSVHDSFIGPSESQTLRLHYSFICRKGHEIPPWQNFTIQRINKFPRCESANFIIVISKPDNCSPVFANTYLTAYCQNRHNATCLEIGA